MAEVVWRGIVVPYVADFDDFRRGISVELCMAELAVDSPMDFAEEWPDEPTTLANLVRLVEAHGNEVRDLAAEDAEELQDADFDPPDGDDWDEVDEGDGA